MSGENREHSLYLVVRNVLVDRITVEVAGAFAADGIETLLLKGPTLARWLYPGEVRTYCDSDLMVAPQTWERAVCTLGRLGFAEHRPWMPDPLSLDPGGVAFERDDYTVDLHCVIPGLDGDPGAIWESLFSDSVTQAIGNAELRVPARDALLLHVALHAAHHANCADSKPLEDLRRAIAGVEEELWCRALDRARAYDGVPAFAAGLRELPAGREIALRLGVDDVRSFRYGLRGQDNVIAEEISAVLSSDKSLPHKLATVMSEVFPRPEYMRWRSSLARRGTVGLTAAYCWRPVWTLAQVPAAVRALWRAYRAVQ